MFLALLPSKRRKVPVVKALFATAHLHSHTLSPLLVGTFLAYVSSASLHRTHVVFCILRKA